MYPYAYIRAYTIRFYTIIKTATYNTSCFSINKHQITA